MRLGSFQAIVRALNGAGVRYLVAGGLAVNAHGFLRMTKDADLVIALDPENIRATFTALAALGYQPLVPLTSDQFASSELREKLSREKEMKVLQFFSDAHRQTPIDVFVSEPFDFHHEYQRAHVRTLDDAGDVPFVSLDTLLRMKREVARAQDLIDVEQLELLQGADGKTP
jgi:hypothetical protein